MNKTSQVRRDILKGWNVLLLDDEPDNLEVALRVLRFYGAHVETAHNGKEGLEKLRAMPVNPRFIISDLSMPVMDGWEFLHELKKNRSTMDIPVIALTAHAMAGDRERGIQAGFQNYLTKPFSPATFMNDLLNLLIEVPEFAAQLA